MTFKYLALLACLAGSPLFADRGDEDAAMFNELTPRDKVVAEDAVRTWWKEAEKTRDARLAPWREARFGMFLHWGVYSAAGGEWKGKPVAGYAEHLMRSQKISHEDYLKLAATFDPVKFDADAWADYAKNAGMGYMILTAKHHDGFAMYDSRVSDWNLFQKTPWHRDPVRELADACHKRGLLFGVYYSHAFDWENPDAPGNDWEFKNPGGDKNLFGGRTWYDAHPEKIPQAAKYVTEKSIPQIKELLTRYPIDILWFDTPHKLPLSENIRIMAAIRETKPGVIVNGRLAATSRINFGDYKSTADRPAEIFPTSGDWEGIPTTNESYGYSKFDHSHKPYGHFVRLVANAVSRGGNMLMNIGPKGDGDFDAPDKAILDGLAGWFKTHAESIRGNGPCPEIGIQNWGVVTKNATTAYLHVFNRPADGVVHVGGLDFSLIANARVLGFTGAAKVAGLPGGAAITLPAGKNDSPDTVIALKLKPGAKPLPGVFIASNIPVTRLLAFDATMTGKFSHGDGKRDQDFLDGWTTTAQSLAWKVVAEKVATYAVSLRLHATKGGKGELHVDGKPVLAFAGDGKPGVRALGDITLQPGEHTLELKAIEVGATGFVAPNELRLTTK